MACFKPLKAWRTSEPTSNGKRKIAFKKSAPSDERLRLKCGQCIGCRLAQSKEWAIRAVHEASLHHRNCFITLTWSPDHINTSGTLEKRPFQLFMKKLRKAYTPNRIRFLHCGEYGSVYCPDCAVPFKRVQRDGHHIGECPQCQREHVQWLGRPHYHALLFNHQFEDLAPYRIGPGGEILYTSEKLSELWPFGFSSVGDLTFESAAYVARYSTKKINGDLAQHHYVKVDEHTGEIVSVLPEYITMSRRPGLAGDWYRQYHSDVHPSDFIIYKGKKYRPPRYYDKLFEEMDPERLEVIKTLRMDNARKDPDNTPARLEVRERIQQMRANKLKRSLNAT